MAYICVSVSIRLYVLMYLERITKGLIELRVVGLFEIVEEIGS